MKKKLSIFVMLFVVAIIIMAPSKAMAATVGSVLTTAENGWQRIDDSDSRIVKVGTWARYDDASNYGGSNLYSGVVNSTLKFKFYGSKLRIIAPLANDKNDNIIIKVDGISSTFNEYVSTVIKQVICFEKTNLANGFHTVEITVPSNPRTQYAVVLDAIDIDDTGYLVDIYQPTNLMATPGDSSVALTWNAVDGATSYNIKRSEISGGPYTPVASVTGTSITYTDNDVVNGKTYYYVVTAVTTSGESGVSNEVSAIATSSSSITGNRAILVISFINGKEKEYDLSAMEIDKFVNWYDVRSEGLGKSYFTIQKHSNVKPFIGRKEYIKFENIESFEIKDYNDI